MKSDKNYLRLYAVTDRKPTDTTPLTEQVRQALQGGATCIQLREKDLNYEEFLNEAMQLKELCTAYGVPFIVNDNVDIAIRCGADGVHVGQSDMNAMDVRKAIGKDMILGVSAQTAEQALLAQQQGADYLGVGAVFGTATKLDADYVSSNTLKEITNSVSIPVVAIGGINESNILQLKGSGIDGVAIVSAIFSSYNIKEACEKLYKLAKEVTECEN